MKNESRQKIALAAWGNIISPVFDATRTVLVAEIADGKVIGRRLESLGPELPYERALRLSAWGVRVLICGAISMGFARSIELNGIQVIPFISGDVRQVTDAYLNGMLMTGAFHMPGCGMGRKRRFRGGNR
jgi:predicted Fe-Mo cluster-binding NifX family protein